MTVAVATAAVVACGGEESEPPERGEGRPNVFEPGKGKSPAVTFEGGEFDGTLYLSAGQDSLNADLYRARGSLDRVQRLTREGRISALTASGETVVVADARGSGSDRVELADLQARQALPGRVIDRYGQTPELSHGGKLLYSVPQYTDRGGDAGYKWYVTTPLPGARKRLALRTRTDDNVGWAPGEALGLLRKGSAKLVVRPGTRAEHTIDSGLRRAQYGFETSSRGDVRFYGPERKIVIVERGGARRVIDGPWAALTWSPDGSSLLVERGRRIGRMSLPDGSVTELGRVGNGDIVGAEWEAGEAP